MGTSAIGGMNIVLSANAASFSAGIAQAQAQLNKFSNTAKAAGHSTASSMQAASASIRLLEGGMRGNIRAAERFISMIPGVGKALQAAFPVVGAIALAGVFIKMGTEVAKFIETTNKMPQAISNGFRTLNLSAQSANDAMRVTNDLLQNQINVLEGKPENNVALALHEAWVEADRLATALDSDNSKMAELMSKSHLSAFAGMLGKMGTANVEGSIGSYEQKFADIGADRNTAVHSGDSAAVARLDKALRDAQTSALNWAANMIAAYKAESAAPGGLNTDANINDLRGFSGNITQAQDKQKLDTDNAQLKVQKERLEEAKKLAEEQKRMAREALEAYKQQQEAIIAQWRKNLEETRADNDMTLAQEGQFWVQRMEQSKRGSLSYIAALEEANKTIARMRQQNMHDQAEFDKNSSAAYALNPLDREPVSGEQGREATAYLRSLNEQISLGKQNSYALAEASTQMDEAAGKMTKLDEATRMASLHTQEYAAYQKDLQRTLDAIANDPALTDLQKAQAAADLNKGAVLASGQRDIQVLTDQKNIAAQQIGPAMHTALDQMVSDWRDMATSIARVMGQAVSGLNDNIVKAMTGQKTSFGATFKQAGQGLLKTGLQKGEGMLLGAFGLGGLKKADGSTEASALWVRMTSAINGGGASTGALGGLLSKIPGMQFIQPFFQGHFAGGGDVLGGYPAMVGEKGPEMFVPRSAGRIVPNHQLSGSAQATHTYMIDARGATDPAAIHAAVARALPHAVAASTQAQHQMHQRKPQGR